MKQGKVVTLKEYKAQRQMKLTRAGVSGFRTSTSPDQLWELLDRNISIEIWKKGI